MPGVIDAASTTNGDLSNVPHVQLGAHSYAVYPQRHAYLTNKLGRAFGRLEGMSGLSGEEGVEGIVGAFGERAYDLLAVFIPRLMPEYEFRGFATREAMEAGEYVEEYDSSPSFPEVVAAFQTCLSVNRLDLLQHLGKVVDLQLLRVYLNQAMTEMFESRTLPSSSSLATT